MPKIASIGTFQPPYTLQQAEIEQLTKELFNNEFPHLERLLKVFANGEIKQRHFCVPLEWHREAHSFQERNNLYKELAVNYSLNVIETCLSNLDYLNEPISSTNIDAIIFVSSTGISTPSLDSWIMNKMKFSDRLKRIPLWGLGCAGGASGISRAYEYCLAYPEGKVLVVCVELCSLTFQPNDYSKSNLIGASLFSDGASCLLICGDKANITNKKIVPSIIGTSSKWMPNSLDVMGWDIQNDGFHVIFSKDIPTIITKWLGPFISEFIKEHNISKEELTHLVAHPGGKKVLLAYEEALNMSEQQTAISREVLQYNGNTSSPTVHYVLEKFMKKNITKEDYGLLIALGPGFSGEAVLLQWRD